MSELSGRVNVGRVLLAGACGLALSVVLGVVWWTHRDVEVEFTSEGCVALGELKIAAEATDGGGCKIGHVNVSVRSMLFDPEMYELSARDGSFEVSIQRRLVTRGVGGLGARRSGE